MVTTVLGWPAGMQKAISLCRGGIAQKIHAAIFAAVKHDTDLVAIGPGAGEIAKLIETISSNAVEVTVV